MSAAEDLQQQRDIGKLWGAVERQGGAIKELRTALVGIDGSNGLRGELREFMAQMGSRMSTQDDVLAEIKESRDDVDEWRQTVESRFDTYMRFEREATCHGKSALNDYLKTIKRDSDSIRKERITVIGAIIVALITSAVGLIK